MALRGLLATAATVLVLGPALADPPKVAAGQRSGRDPFNFRADDPGPAPMGVAFTLHQPSASKEPRK